MHKYFKNKKKRKTRLINIPNSGSVNPNASLERTRRSRSNNSTSSLSNNRIEYLSSSFRVTDVIYDLIFDREVEKR